MSKTFWAPLLELIRHMKAPSFIRPNMDVSFRTVDRVEDVLPAIYAAAQPPRAEAEAVVAEKF